LVATAEGEYGGGAAAIGDEADAKEAFPEPKGAGGGGGDFLTKVLLEECDTAVAEDVDEGERPRDVVPVLKDRFWVRSFAEWAGKRLELGFNGGVWQGAYTWKRNAG
jgi:hypothetical protein